MKYRNKLTGVIVEVSSIISGGNWEAVAEKKLQKKPVKRAGKKAADKND